MNKVINSIFDTFKAIIVTIIILSIAIALVVITPIIGIILSVAFLFLIVKASIELEKDID